MRRSQQRAMKKCLQRILEVYRGPYEKQGHLEQWAAQRVVGFARTAEDLCDIALTRGLEPHDEPRTFFRTIQRWARGEAFGPELAVATRRIHAYARSTWSDGPGSEHTDPLATLAVNLGDRARWIKKLPTNLSTQDGFAREALARCLAALTGDPLDACSHRVTQLEDAYAMEAVRAFHALMALHNRQTEIDRITRPKTSIYEQPGALL